MNIYTGLLFQQGYIQDPKLAMSLAGAVEPQVPPRAGGDQATASEPPKRRERRASFRRGAISAVCSVALSPFR
jgi:hypothetical protein